MAPRKRGRATAAQKEEKNGTPKVSKGVAMPQDVAVARNDSKTVAKAAALSEEGEKNLQPVIVFAHGAGAGSSSDWMVRWKALLASGTTAVEVRTFDYPYLEGGKKGAPPKAEKLVGAHISQIQKATSIHPGSPVVLVGKSMGSRVSCMVAGNQDISVAAVVCLGYPLKGMNGKFRDDTLLEMRAPVLFVQGTKDSMCPLDKLKEVQNKMSVENDVHIIEGGDHGFKVPAGVLKKNGLTLSEVEKQAVCSINSFLTKVLSGSS